MTIPRDRDGLLAAIRLEFGKLTKTLAEVPPAHVHERSMEGQAKGTRMSPFDLVAYLTGWNELVLKWLERDAAGKAIDFPETGFKWNELGRLAGKFYADYEAIAYPALLERLHAANGRIVAFLERTDDAALSGRPW